MSKDWYDPSKVSDSDFAREVERLRGLSSVGWDREARMLRQFGLRPGMSLLEVGCGPGFITEKLAELLPGGAITAVDKMPNMVEYAAHHLHGRLAIPVRHLEASATSLPLPDASFDFVYARMMLQHVDDTVAAAREFKRVLKPGGHVVLNDIDFDLPPLTEPPIPSHRVLRERAVAGGFVMAQQPHIGRRLWGALQRAGFAHVDIEIVAQHSGNGVLADFTQQVNPELALPLLAAGLMSEAEMVQLRREFDAFVHDEYPFFLRLMIAACGVKSP